MTTDEHTLRIYALRDQLDAIDRQEAESNRLYADMRERVEEEIEKERDAADPTGMRAKASKLIRDRGQMSVYWPALGTPQYTFGVRMTGRVFPFQPLVIEAVDATQDAARERLIAMVIARWQEWERMRADA